MPNGPLVIIGGHEDREGAREILREVADHVGSKRLLLLAAASKAPSKYVDIYRAAFEPLGVELYAPTLEELLEHPDVIADVGGVFMSGGNQLRLMDAIGGTDIERQVRAAWERGAVVAGTSAGASAMSDVMITRGPGDETPDESDITLGKGLGLIAGVLIDQHFAERGRIGRLVAARTAGVVGIGIDENTAIVVEANRLRVIGVGAAYVLEDPPAGASGHLLHVLTRGDEFELPA